MKRNVLYSTVLPSILSLVMLLSITTDGLSVRRQLLESAFPEVAEQAKSLALLEKKLMYRGKAEPLTAEQESLYEDTVMVLLKENLWTARDMYDACHYLMTPMYYAFWRGDEVKITAFADFFGRFAKDLAEEDQYDFQSGGMLNRLHFLYFSTQFAKLCAAHNREDLIPSGLLELAEETAENYLLHHPANWGTEPTVIEHMRQVLAGKKYAKSYLSSIEDLDGFTLAILCDLHYLTVLRGETPSETMETAADLVWQIYSSPLLNKETARGGWLFQQGISYDHVDMAYAGNQRITEDIQPKPREDVPGDSSHAHRLPLWLLSYQSAQTDRSRQERFALRREQLANQMVHYVLKSVGGYWLTTTFMDGTNGVYRYSHDTEGVGLEGYDLSGTFLVGWWTFLRDTRITSCYRDILRDFPLKGNTSNPYFDHATVREQNPFFDMETGFDNGMFECIVACAGNIT